MNYSQKLERAVLEECKTWRFHPEYPNKRTPFLYPETVSEFSKLLEPVTSDRGRQWAYLKEHLEILSDCEWIKLDHIAGETFEASITPKEMARLDWHDSQTWDKKFARSLSTASGVLFSSVVLPVIAAVGTVILMRYLGLDTVSFGLEATK